MKMGKQTDKILLNDILKLSELNNVRIRFNIKFSDHDNPIELLKNNDCDHLMKLLDPRVRGIFIVPSLIVLHEV